VACASVRDFICRQLVASPNRFQRLSGQLVLIDNHAWYLTQAVLVMTAGTMLLMWLGEQITERGIGTVFHWSSPSASWRGCPRRSRP